jgi:hypothetical protein
MVGVKESQHYKAIAAGATIPHLAEAMRLPCP